MNKTEEVLAAAAAIQTHLPELLGDQAEAVKAQLEVLLAKANQGKKVESEIIKLLDKHDPTRVWMNQALETGQEVVTKGGGALSYSNLASERGVSELLGARAHVAGAKYYKCPQGDYQWTKTTDWQQVPKCPHHDCDLIEDV